MPWLLIPTCGTWTSVRYRKPIGYSKYNNSNASQYSNIDQKVWLPIRMIQHHDAEEDKDEDKDKFESEDLNMLCVL